MTKPFKLLILLLFAAVVIFTLIVASGYSYFTECDYYKLRRTSLIPILGIALLSFLVSALTKMEKDIRYIFVIGVTFFSFWTKTHFYNKKYNELLVNQRTTVTKAAINDIIYNQFSTLFKVKTIPKKFWYTIDLKNKNDIGNLKIGDTILIKYVTSCSSIVEFHNLSPSKEELEIYNK